MKYTEYNIGATYLILPRLPTFLASLFHLMLYARPLLGLGGGK